MVHGANKSGARKKRFVRTPSGTKTRYAEKKPGKAKCASGRPLPGTPHGNKSHIAKHAKTKRRPSRPFGGVLSAPMTKAVMKERAAMLAPVEDGKPADLYALGRVCVKLAGRDAGGVCVIVDHAADKVLIDGQTRRRKVRTTHLEPTGHLLKVSKAASHDAVIKALKTIDVTVTEHKPQKKRLKKSVSNK